jgi:methionine-rich copper-binding protein CopC
MRRAAFIATFGGLLLSAAAMAHTHLAKSDPADGSVLRQAPGNVSLQFAHAVRVTELSIQKGDEKSRPLLVPLPEKPDVKVSAVAPKLTPGAYVVSWRAVSGDGHVMSGKIRFTVAEGKAGDPAATH